ncbi:MAG: hypothetical protein Q8K72_11675 [Acidimicrobiales bacterium]|nr:hypothetical protein [Acidimicrobiales bacterium]
MRTRYRLRTNTPAAAVALILLALTAVACGGDKKAPNTTAPAGFTVASSDKEGFALAVPSEWTQIPLSINPADFDQEANRLRLANPKLASILNQARVLGQAGGKFMAVAPDGLANVNLTVDKPKEKSVEEIVTASIDGLTNFEATDFNQEPATLNGKPAVKLTFRLPVQTDAGTVPTDEVQYYLLDDSKAYILTVAGAGAEVASAIAGSLRLR